jgi:MOSC domain-containing protein YiiM
MARLTDGQPARGRVVAISISAQKGTPKTNVPAARLIVDHGLEHDAHAGPGPRQVSLLAIESIDKIRARGLDVAPGAFAENITTQFVRLPGLHVGDRVRIGPAELVITQIGKECHSRCAIFATAGDCVMPREGVFAQVVTGGDIRVGDPVEIVVAAGAEGRA